MTSIVIKQFPPTRKTLKEKNEQLAADLEQHKIDIIKLKKELDDIYDL